MTVTERSTSSTPRRTLGTRSQLSKAFVLRRWVVSSSAEVVSHWEAEAARRRWSLLNIVDGTLHSALTRKLAMAVCA
jgi:hypothetical protein